jgi:hypothetical protein
VIGAEVDDAMSVASLEENASTSADESVAGANEWRPVATGLEAALMARAPGVHTGTPLVRKLADEVGRLLGLDDHERLAVEVCARVRDIGMISLPDYVILNADVLSDVDLALLSPRSSHEPPSSRHGCAFQDVASAQLVGVGVVALDGGRRENGWEPLGARSLVGASACRRVGIGPGAAGPGPLVPLTSLRGLFGECGA